MRKPQFGGYEVDRRRRYPLSGVWILSMGRGNWPWQGC